MTPPGGFSHGLAARLTLANGNRVFAKAVAADDGLARAYRAEARYAGQLSPQIPAPRLRFVLDTNGWVALVFDDVEGRHPNLSDPAELSGVLHLIEQHATALTPNPVLDAPQSPPRSAKSSTFGATMDSVGHLTMSWLGRVSGVVWVAALG
jgi:hypothetical protein